MFYIGQKVVCLESIGELEKDNIYIVDYIDSCKKCGCIGIGVGINCISSVTGFGRCKCGDIYHMSDYEKIHHTYQSSRFAPLETYRESYSIAIELVQELEQVDKQKIFNPKKVEI